MKFYIYNFITFRFITLDILKVFIWEPVQAWMLLILDQILKFELDFVDQILDDYVY